MAEYWFAAAIAVLIAGTVGEDFVPRGNAIRTDGADRCSPSSNLLGVGAYVLLPDLIYGHAHPRPFIVSSTKPAKRRWRRRPSTWRRPRPRWTDRPPRPRS